LSTSFDGYKDTYRDAVQDSIAFSGLDMEFFTERKANHLLRSVESRLGPPSKLRAVDVGCGVGLTDRLLAPLVGELHGVDMAEGLLETAARANPGVRYQCYDGARLPFNDGELDLSFAINVLHHVPLPARPSVVREMARVVRPGGIVALYEHNPLNPLTRLAVSRCAFDADAVLLGRRELTGLALGACLRSLAHDYIVFFPFRASVFSRVEQVLDWLPLGAQHCVLAEK